MSTPWTTRWLAPSEAAIIHHPDRRTAWAPSIVVTLAGPADGRGAEHGVGAEPGRDAAVVAEQIRARLAALVAAHPILDARLDGDRWIAGSGRLHLETMTDELALLRHRFDLTAGPPCRVALSPDSRRLAVVGHHAALDGRALLLVARALLGGESPRRFDREAPSLAAAQPVTQPRDANRPVEGRDVSPPAAAQPGTQPRDANRPLEGRNVSPPAGRPAALAALARLARPADRVAPSSPPATTESFVTAPIPDHVRVRVAPLAAAAVAAAAAHNYAAAATWNRVGLTIPVGGPDVLGNVSTHRRLDLPASADVAAAVQAALATADEPVGSGHSAAVVRLLGPVVDRFSDSLLVSNLGLVDDLPGAEAVDFYPQARGRSAVALGACSVDGGRRVLTLRARDLSESDAQSLLDAAVRRLG